MTVGDRIRKQRELIGMSQIELAEKMSVSKQTLYKYEMNKITNIPSDKLEKAASALGVTPSYLMGWDESDRLSDSNAKLDAGLIVNMDDEARKLLIEYKKMDETHKELLMKYVELLNKDSK